jgi:hypothetical protein
VSCSIKVNTASSTNTTVSLPPVVSKENKFFEQNWVTTSESTIRPSSPVLQRRRPDEFLEKNVISNDASLLNIPTISRPVCKLENSKKFVQILGNYLLNR